MEHSPDMAERCAEYVALMERGNTLVEVAERYGLTHNSVHSSLKCRGLPTSMKEAVRAYWKRQDATRAADLVHGRTPAAKRSHSSAAKRRARKTASASAA